MEFLDRLHGSCFPEIRPWRPLFAIPVEIVDVVPGTDNSHSGAAGQIVASFKMFFSQRRVISYKTPGIQGGKKAG